VNTDRSDGTETERKSDAWSESALSLTESNEDTKTNDRDLNIAGLNVGQGER
jgi:hypothetical protein